MIRACLVPHRARFAFYSDSWYRFLEPLSSGWVPQGGVMKMHNFADRREQVS